MNKSKKSLRLGEIKNGKYGIMKIVEYYSSDNIVVEFQDDYKYRKNTSYDNFLKDNIKNIYKPLYYDVACVGNSSVVDNIGELKQSYRHWSQMIKRCYGSNITSRTKNYIDCYVCNEWLIYENFEKWFNNNYYRIDNETMCLDKDILFDNNKIYSPDTCIFVPSLINSIFVTKKKIKENTPIGIQLRNGKYVVRINKFGKRENLGSFKNINDAIDAYIKEKELYYKEVAEKYKNKIPDIVYARLCNKQVMQKEYYDSKM